MQKILPEQQERYQFSYLCEEAYERLGPPLSPEDIDKLIEKGRLEEVIFSPRYMLTEDDYVEFHGDLSEVYKELAKRRKPRYGCRSIWQAGKQFWDTCLKVSGTRQSFLGR